jgi:hypothetical protein
MNNQPEIIPADLFVYERKNDPLGIIQLVDKVASLKRN